MNVIFMGTPQFAVPPLLALISAGHNIMAVYSQPDRPSGRGYKLSPTPVKAIAQEHGIPVFQPEGFKGPEERERLSAMAPDVIAVVAYGRILPQAVLDIPKYGCINIHASLLPKYRGAAPIQWCVINGETRTGVCSMAMAAGMDTGDVILRFEAEIGENETAPQLSGRLSSIGADCLRDTLDLLEKGHASCEKQDSALATYAPMIKKELGLLDFTRPARELHCLVRGLAGWPTAYAYFEGRLIKLHRALVAPESFGEPGELCERDGRLFVSCGEGALEVLELQLEGRAKSPTAEFLRGHKINSRAKFTNR